MRTNVQRSRVERGVRSSGLLVLWSSATLGALAHPQKAYVTNATSNDVTVIDTTRDIVLSTVPVGTTPGRLAISVDGKYAYVPNAGSDDVSVLSTASDAVTGTIAVGDGPTIAAVSPDGARLYVGGANGIVAVVDTRLGVQVGSITTGAPSSGGVNGLAVSPDGSRVYALWGNLVVIDAATSMVVSSVYAGNSPNDLALTANGARIYVSDSFGYGAFSFDGCVAVIAAESQAFAGAINTWSLPTSIAIAPDGASAWVSAPYRFFNTGYGMGYLSSTWIERLDLATNTLASSVNTSNPPGAVALTSDGARAYVAIPTGNRVAVIDTASNALVTTVATGVWPSGVAITRPGKSAGLGPWTRTRRP